MEGRILEQQGIGRYLGQACFFGLGFMEEYERYVELWFSSGKYYVAVYDNPVYEKKNKNIMINCEANLEFAKNVYMRIVENDKKEKQSIIHRLFSRS